MMGIMKVYPAMNRFVRESGFDEDGRVMNILRYARQKNRLQERDSRQVTGIFHNKKSGYRNFCLLKRMPPRFIKFRLIQNPIRFSLLERA